MNLKFEIDENLREVLLNHGDARREIEALENELILETISEKKAKLLGTLGVISRCMGELAEAESYLVNAIDLIKQSTLGVRLLIQQNIRLAHVYQWQRNYAKSNKMFSELLIECRNNPEANDYLDFALQHSGKNLFDQKNYKEALNCFKEALELRVRRSAPEDQIASTHFAIQRTNTLIMSILK